MFGKDNDIRPDKVLETRLLLLVAMLTLTILSIGFLFAYPQYLRPIILSVFVFIISSIFITITILQSGEKAILYGGLANEILKNRKTCYIILDNKSNIVLQNELAKNLLQNTPILEFLDKYILKDENNTKKLKQLALSSKNLKENTVEIPLKFDTKTIFTGQTWYKIHLRPISLNNDEENIDTNSNENIYMLWSIEDITSQKTISTIFQEERRSFYNFLNFLPIGIYILNSKNKIQYVNKTLSLMLGKTKEELLGNSISDFIFKKNVLPLFENYFV